MNIKFLCQIRYGSLILRGSNPGQDPDPFPSVSLSLDLDPVNVNPDPHA